MGTYNVLYIDGKQKRRPIIIAPFGYNLIELTYTYVSSKFGVEKISKIVTHCNNYTNMSRTRLDVGSIR